MTEKAYKYRFYPTPKQKAILAQTFGCARYVYNWALNLRTKAYREQKKNLTYNDLSSALTDLKREAETIWLKDVSSVPLQQALRHQERAFGNFFEKRAAYPKFKKKHHRQSVAYTRAAFSYDGEGLSLAKLPGALDVHWSRPLGRDAQRLKKAQQDLAKKMLGSKNRDKARQKVARIHAGIADRRNDFLHKFTTALIHKNQVICAESLQVKNMVKHPTLAKAISDAGWGELTRQLAYKAKWYGRTFVQIDTFFPSSNTVSRSVNPTSSSTPAPVTSWLR